MTRWWRAVGASLAIAMLAAFGLLFTPGWAREIWVATSLGVSAAFVVQVIALLAEGKMKERSAYEGALQSAARRVDRPADLEALERAFGWRTYSGDEFDHRIRPALRRLARSRLGGAEPPPALADLLSEVPTSASVRTPQIAGTISEIEGLD